MLAANPGPNVGAPAATPRCPAPRGAVHQFLRTGQYTARTADDRLEVYRVMTAGGPEVQAAAKVALAGPASYIAYFLTASRYQAAPAGRRAGRAHVRGAGADRAGTADTRRPRCPTRPRPTGSPRWPTTRRPRRRTGPTRPAQSAQRAAEYAADARDSAGGHADRRTRPRSPPTPPATRPTRPTASANSAARSAATATAAAQRATRDAGIAREAAWAARASAKAAGADAAAANAAAKQASAIYAQRLKEIEQQRRSTAPGAAPTAAPRSTTTRPGAAWSPPMRWTRPV